MRYLDRTALLVIGALSLAAAGITATFYAVIGMMDDAMGWEE